MIHSISYAQWTRISSPTVSDLSDIHFPNESIGYIVSEKGIVLKSIDKGKSWHIIYNDSTKVFNSVFFTSLNTGYATSINHGVFKTADRFAGHF
jgi:photosystem II stability/assembly factor-like uncharacterized protein